MTATLDDALQLAGNLQQELNDVATNATLDYHVQSLVSRALDTTEQTKEFIERAIAKDDALNPEDR